MGNLFHDIWWTIIKGYYFNVTDIYSDLWKKTFKYYRKVFFYTQS